MELIKHTFLHYSLAEYAPESSKIDIQKPERSNVHNDNPIPVQNSANNSLNSETMPRTSISLVKELRQDIGNDLISSNSKRDERLSPDKIMVKKEKDLELARQAIRNLQSHLGTVILSDDSESDAIGSTDEEGVKAETEQNDALFAHQYNFKTNVRNPYIILI